MSAYSCPDCKWNPLDQDDFYYVKRGRAIPCGKWDEEKNRLFADPPPPYKAYPVYENMVGPSFYASYEFGVSNGYDWEETHFCPKCKKEFSFSNGNY